MSGGGCDGADAVRSRKRFHTTEYRLKLGFYAVSQLSPLRCIAKKSKKLVTVQRPIAGAAESCGHARRPRGAPLPEFNVIGVVALSAAAGLPNRRDLGRPGTRGATIGSAAGSS